VRAVYTYYPGSGHLYYAMAPHTENRSHTITAYVEIPKGGADGVLVANGGSSCGYSLFIKDGRPTFTYNFCQAEITTISDPHSLPAGPATIQLRFAYDGGGLGKGATATLYVNGSEVAEGRLPRTVAAAFTFDETFDVGEDSSTPVGDYRSPFPFRGTLRKLELEFAPSNLSFDDEDLLRESLERAFAIEQ
jgi:hypothetical protein